VRDNTLPTSVYESATLRFPTGRREAVTQSTADADHQTQDDGFVDRALPLAVRAAADTIDLESIVQTVVDRCAETIFTRHADDEDFRHRLMVSVSQNAYALRDVLAGRLRICDVRLEHVLSFATVQAQLRIPQMAMHRSYRVSFFLQWEFWAAHLRAHARRAVLDPHDEADAVAHLTRILLSYQDHVASQVAETYTRDYETLNRSRVHVRRNLVRAILQNETFDLTASDLTILSYPLDAHHIAVLLPTMAEGAASQLAEGLRQAAMAQRTLLHPLTLNSTVVWLCRPDSWSERSTTTMKQVLQELGVTASMSSPASGVDGLRQTLRQAQQTERVRAARGEQTAPPLMAYADAALEILLLQDDELARRFVETELRTLASSSAEAIRLRETLEASFRFGSHVAAAEHLQLHEHTVRNRLHKVEELLGHPLQERRTELQVAMRLVHLLADVGDGPG
jgi:sugar diacid utilization regulator